jgi:prefoldin subunit 5
VQAGFRNEMYNELSNKLEMLSREYNALAAKTNQLPIVFETISNSKEANSMSCFVMLNQLTLVQRTVLQNQRTLLTTK